MKKWMKICLTVCAVFFLVGLIGVGVGAAMGVRPGQVEKALRNEYKVRYHGDRWDDHDYKDDHEYDDDYEHHEQRPETENFQVAAGTYEGVVGDRDVRKLKLKLDAAVVNLCLGDEDTIYMEAANTGKNFAWKQEGSTLLIRDNRARAEVDPEALELNLYLPKKTFDEMEFEVGAGEFYAEKLDAASLDVELGAGAFSIDEAIVNNKAEFNVGIGELLVDYYQGGNLDLDCGVGNLEIQVAGNYNDYNYEVECGIGSIELGDNAYSGLGQEQNINNQAAKQMEIDCGTGSIVVSFTE